MSYFQYGSAKISDSLMLLVTLSCQYYQQEVPVETALNAHIVPEVSIEG